MARPVRQGVDNRVRTPGCVVGIGEPVRYDTQANCC